MGKITQTSKQANGTLAMRGLVFMLALLILPLSGMASAEQSTSMTAADERIEVVGLDTEFEFLDLDGEVRDLDSYNIYQEALDLTDVEERDELDLSSIDDGALEVLEVVVVVYTDGDMAWVMVIVIYEDWSYDVFRTGLMELSIVRERLADFDGIVVVIWTDFGNDDDEDDVDQSNLLVRRILSWMWQNNITIEDLMNRCPLTDDIVGNEDASDWSQGQAFACRVLLYLRAHWDGFGDSDDTDDEDNRCPSGYLNGKWALSDTHRGGDFKGYFIDSEGNIRGTLSGQFAAGHFRGVASSMDGQVLATLSGTYSNGSYSGEWSTLSGSLDGVLAGQYKGNGDGQGVFRGQWKADCSDNIDPVPMPKPIAPTMICKKVTITSDVNIDNGGTVLARELAPDFWKFTGHPRPLGPDANDGDSVKPVGNTTTQVVIICKRVVIPYGDDIVEVPDDSRCKPTVRKVRDSDVAATRDCKVIIVGDDDGAVKITPVKVKESLEEIGKKPVLTTQGGFTVDVEDAAAGGVLGSIPLLGLSLLRRKFGLL
jgi:hypothetical protein